MTMIRQILSLLLLAGALSLLVGLRATSKPVLAQGLVAHFGTERAVEVARAGTWSAYLTLVRLKLAKILPWFALGAAVAAFARVSLWWWMKPQAKVDRVILRDEAGGTVVMEGVQLNHDPGIRFLAADRDAQVGPGASQFENEVFGSIVAAGDPPYHPDDPAGARLSEFCRSAWLHIVAKHGAGSLASMLMLSSEAGKIIAFRQQGGTWVAVTDKHTQQSANAIRKMRAYYELPKDRRDDLTLCLSVLASGFTPVDLSDELRSVIVDVKIAALGKGAAAGSPTPEGAVDPRAIASAVAPMLASAIAGLNINKKQSPSDALDGIHVSKHSVVLIPPQQMRRIFNDLLPPGTSDTLKLEMPAERRHPSDPVLFQVLNAAGVLVKAFGDFKSDSGAYAARSGQRKFACLWGISTASMKDDVIRKWGDWELDVEVTGPGDINVG